MCYHGVSVIPILIYVFFIHLSIYFFIIYLFYSYDIVSCHYVIYIIQLNIYIDKRVFVLYLEYAASDKFSDDFNKTHCEPK